MVYDMDATKLYLLHQFFIFLKYLLLSFLI